MRVGQKTQRTRVWARRGTRPRQVADLRTSSAYLYGAICPQRLTGAAVVLQRADTQGMQHHLNEISANVAPGAHAVLVLDQAGWHTKGKLIKPANITFLPLPPRSPELNPAEKVWQYLRGRWLSTHVFDDYEHILDAVCDAWDRYINEPQRIASIGTRSWVLTAPFNGGWYYPSTGWTARDPKAKPNASVKSRSTRTVIGPAISPRTPSVD